MSAGRVENSVWLLGCRGACGVLARTPVVRAFAILTTLQNAAVLVESDIIFY